MLLPGASKPRFLIGLLYVVLVIACAMTLIIGLQANSQTGKLGGAIGLIVVVATAPVALLLAELYGRLRDVAPISRQVDRIHEHTMLSDNAKRVLFRDRETQLLRSAIEDDIARGDYNAAITLCEEMANLFGYREEAEAFRSRITRARQEQYEFEVQAAVDQFEVSLGERNWAAVHQQAARIRRLYPDSHLVGELDQRIQLARHEHKSELESRFLEAARREDVETAMDLLKQLDLYLGRDEAGRLTEVAEGVIMRHRENLGAAFRIAVNDHRWSEAARLGGTIIAEFPNTQMAAEVRSMIEVLRTRAGQGAVATDEN
ncbi:MAG: hypothetical protein ACYSU2_19215 [Planctomycetota bacterium]|jgi:hypothetical protein